MKKEKFFKRERMEWAVLPGTPVALYVSGLHTEVLGGVQRAFLSARFVQPTELSATRQEGSSQRGDGPIR